jgi:glutamate/tyrosine decarboxylase-like PLP-dependent enzyme
MFPERGIVWKNLERELWEARLKDLPWQRGSSFMYWPDPGDNLGLVAKAAANHIDNQRILGRRGNPSALKVEAEVKQMVKEILGAPDDGATTLTIGGTESNFHAVKVVRDWARVERPDIKAPEIVVPYTAHPSFDKAGHILDVQIVRVPPGEDFRADVAAMTAAITDNTVMIVGSAPSFPHGVIDPIGEIGALAEARGIWGHVDACVGGFLIPFLRDLGRNVGAFDFSVAGVRSISADLHKFGYTPTGISTFTLRDEADLVHQRFAFDDWSYGHYQTETFAGSRNAAAVAGAWAVLKHLGAEGYRTKAEQILTVTTALQTGIEAIDGLRILAPPEAGILLFTSDDFDIVAVSDGLTARGFPSRWNKEPPAIHLLISSVDIDPIVTDYLAALDAVVSGVKAGEIKRLSDEAVYS